MNTLQTITFSDGTTLEIWCDEMPIHPREDGDMLGTMVCFHRKYNLGDEHSYHHEDYPGWEGLKEQIEKDHDVALILPVYMIDHSGLALSTKPFGCPWDSGQVGWIFTTHDAAKEAFQVDEVDDATLEKVSRCLNGEIDLYGKYVNGEVYGFTHYEKCPTCGGKTEEKDSCGGFYGYDFSENGMADHIDSDYHDEFLEKVQ